MRSLNDYTWSNLTLRDNTWNRVKVNMTKHVLQKSFKLLDDFNKDLFTCTCWLHAKVDNHIVWSTCTHFKKKFFWECQNGRGQKTTINLIESMIRSNLTQSFFCQCSIESITNKCLITLRMVRIVSASTSNTLIVVTIDICQSLCDVAWVVESNMVTKQKGITSQT